LPRFGEALAEELEQLFRGSESPLPGRVDFFDPSDELSCRRIALGTKSQHKCLSHQASLGRRRPKGVKLTCNFRESASGRLQCPRRRWRIEWDHAVWPETYVQPEVLRPDLPVLAEARAEYARMS
jgi:hypothetical protein